MKQSMYDVCTPRQSTFDQDRRDVVLQLSDLFDGKYSQDIASGFFEENFVTNGMKVLVNKAFDRLLARYPKLRKNIAL